MSGLQPGWGRIRKMRLILSVLLTLCFCSNAQAAIGYIQKASNYSDAAGTTLAVTVSSTGAGNLIAAFSKWEGADTTADCDDGTTSFDAGTKENHTNGDLHGQWFYLLSSASGKTTINCTWTGSVPYRRVHVYEFSTTAAITLDQQSTAEAASSTAVNSGNITTTGTDEVVLASYGEYSGAGLTSPLINAVAADQSIINSPGGTFTSSWERIVTATFTGAGTATLDGLNPWIALVISFKAGAAPASTCKGRLALLGAGC